MVLLMGGTLTYQFYQELLKENSNPRLKGNRKGIVVKGKEFYIPILKQFLDNREISHLFSLSCHSVYVRFLTQVCGRK